MRKHISSFIGVAILGGLRLALAQVPAGSLSSPTIWKDIISHPAGEKKEPPEATPSAKRGLSARKDAVLEDNHFPERDTTSISSKPRLTYFRKDKKNPRSDSPK